MIKRIAIVLLLAAGLGPSMSCSTVPKEAVELSYTMGQDLEEVHASYRSMVQIHFSGIRAEVERKINEVYLPAYLFGTGIENPGFVKSGELEQWVQEKDVEGVTKWALIAVTTIDNRRREELEPFNAKEKELLAEIDESFDCLTRANATITAHLNSLREVEEVQDQALKALNLDGLRKSIQKKLDTVSDDAADMTARFDVMQKAADAFGQTMK